MRELEPKEKPNEAADTSNSNAGIAAAAAEAYTPRSAAATASDTERNTDSQATQSRTDIPEEPELNEIPKEEADSSNPADEYLPQMTIEDLSRAGTMPNEIEKEAELDENPKEAESAPKAELPGQQNIEDIYRSFNLLPGDERYGNQGKPSSEPLPDLPGIRWSDYKMTHPVSPTLDYGWVPDGMNRALPAVPGPKPPEEQNGQRNPNTPNNRTGLAQPADRNENAPDVCDVNTPRGRTGLGQPADRNTTNDFTPAGERNLSAPNGRTGLAQEADRDRRDAPFPKAPPAGGWDSLPNRATSDMHSPAQESKPKVPGPKFPRPTFRPNHTQGTAERVPMTPWQTVN